MAAVLQDFLLPLDLVSQRVLDSFEGVDVLHLRLRTQLLRPRRTKRDIQIGAEISLLHAAIRDVNIFKDRLDFFHIGARFLRRRHIRLGHDLDQRHAGTVVVHVRRCGVLDGRSRMDQLACVLLHVDARDADPLLPLLGFDIHIAVLCNRQIVLRRLEIFRKVGIIIILPVELAEFIDRAVQRDARLDGELDDAPVDNGKHPGKPKANRAHMGILLGPEGRRTAAENFRIRF